MADAIQADKERDEAHRALTAASRSRPMLFEQPDTVVNDSMSSGVLVDPRHLRLVLAALSAAEARERVLRETLEEISEASWPDHETGTGVERIQRFAARALTPETSNAE